RFLDRIAELAEEREELVEAAVDVADDVERSALVAQVVAQRLARDRRRRDLLRRGEDEDVAKAFAREAAERAPRLLDVVLDDPRPEGAVGPRAIALDADPLRQVEDDGDGNTVVLARESDERLARRGLDVGRVDDGQPPSRKPLGGNVVQDVKGVLRRRLA